MPVYDRQYNIAKHGRFDSKWEARIVYLTSFLSPHLLPCASVRKTTENKMWLGKKREKKKEKMQLAGCLANKMPIMLATIADLCLPPTRSVIKF